MMINPAEINFSLLPWLPLEEKSSFPQNPAIYFAIDKHEIVQYIGRSINPKMRWINHHKYDKLKSISDIRIVYLFVDSIDFLPQIESALIDWFNPPLNIIGKKKELLDYADSEYSEVITRLRNRSGLTQKQVADQLEMTVQTISNWETGARLPKLTPKQTLILCRVLECSLEELAGDNQAFKH